METSNIYDFVWACTIAQEFTKKYPRACKAFQQFTNYRDVYPAELISKDQGKWERFKKIIKLVDKFDKSEGEKDFLQGTGKQLYSDFIIKTMLDVQKKHLFSRIELKKDA